MHVLLFDIDGTLIRTGGAGGTALMGAFSEVFGIAEPGEVPFSGRTDRGIAHALFRLHRIPLEETNWERLRTAYLERLPEQLPRHAGEVLPGVLRLLSELLDRSDVLLGLLTGNIQEGARIKLDHFQLGEYFRCGGFGDQHEGREEVATEALRAAQAVAAAPLEPERVWVIGDTPLDVACARHIRARVVAVTTGFHPRDELAATRPDLLLDSLDDLRPALGL